MSLLAKSNTRLKQLYTGMHLVMIDDMWLTKDGQGNILTTLNGQVPMTIRFTDSKGYSFDNNYLLKGDTEFIFHKMCTAFRVDYTVKKLKNECGIDIKNADGTIKEKATEPRKRGYIFIREVHDVDGTEVVKDEITGLDIVNYYIFDYAPFLDGQKPPARKGCPTEGKPASDDFIDYRQINAIDKQLAKQKLTKAEKLELGKRVIAETMAKKDDTFTLEAEFVEPEVVKPLPVDKEFEERYGASYREAIKEDELVLEEDIITSTGQFKETVETDLPPPPDKSFAKDIKRMASMIPSDGEPIPFKLSQEEFEKQYPNKFDAPALVEQVKNHLLPNEGFFDQPESPIFGKEDVILVSTETSKPAEFILEEELTLEDFVVSDEKIAEINETFHTGSENKPAELFIEEDLFAEVKTEVKPTPNTEEEPWTLD